ncbi:MAG: hypothetical protein J5663_03855 [Bacteroidaceae bacterium]|nr:hypothetical protein [Bacteroidaceae bacterium]
MMPLINVFFIVFVAYRLLCASPVVARWRNVEASLLLYYYLLSLCGIPAEDGWNG